MRIAAWSRELLHEMARVSPLVRQPIVQRRRPERHGGAHGGAPPRGSAAAAALSGALTTAVWAAIALLAPPAAAAATAAAIHGRLSHFRKPAESPHEERGETRDTNGRRTRQKGGNGRQARASGWVVVGAAAGLGKAARRAPAAAAGRARGGGKGRVRPHTRDEARKSDEGQTGGLEAAGGARNQCPDPSG